MQNDSGQRIPSDFGMATFKHTHRKVLLAIREALSNACNYKASHLYAAVIETPDLEVKHHLVIGHTGEPMNSEEEVLNVALAPYKSGGREGALNGVGIAYSSSILCQSPMQVVIGTKIGNRLFFGKGSSPTRNLWHTCPDEYWEKKIPEVMGKDYVDECNVWYIFPMQGVGDTARHLAEKYANCLAFLCPSFLTKIERGGKRNANTAQNGVAAYVVETVIKSGETMEGLRERAKNAGAIRRPLATLEEYLERYQTKQYDFPVQPFEIEVDDGISWRINNAVVTVHAFWVEKDQGDGHFKTVRDGEKFDFAQGSASFPGVAPSETVYGYMPCIYNSEPHESLVRYLDNPTYMDNDVRSIMVQHLKLNCSTKGNRFVILTIRVNDVQSKVVSNGSVSYESVPAMRYGDFLHRRSDFTFSNTALVRKILNECCKNVDQDSALIQDARIYFKEMFPQQEGEFIKIDFSNEKEYEEGEGDGGGGGGIPDARLRYIDPVTAKTLVRDVQPGEFVNFVIFDNVDRKTVAPSALSVPLRHQINLVNSGVITEITKSLTSSQIAAVRKALSLDEDSPLHAYSIQVHALEISKDGGNTWQPANSSQEYVSAARRRPGRRINLVINTKEKAFLHIDSPIVIERDNNNEDGEDGNTSKGGHGDGDGSGFGEGSGGKGIGKVEKKGGKKKKVTGDIPEDPWTERHPEILCEWREGENFVRLNQNTPFFKQYMVQREPRIDEKGKKLYLAINSICKGYKDGLLFHAPPLSENLPILVSTPDYPNGEPWQVNPWDYAMNRALSAMLYDDKESPIASICREIDDLIPKYFPQHSEEGKVA